MIAARADPDRAGAARDIADRHRGRRAGDADHIVMFGQPVAIIAPALGMLGEIERIAQRLPGRRSLRHGREIENGKGRFADCRHRWKIGTMGRAFKTRFVDFAKEPFSRLFNRDCSGRARTRNRHSVHRCSLFKGLRCGFVSARKAVTARRSPLLRRWARAARAGHGVAVPRARQRSGGRLRTPPKLAQFRGSGRVRQRL